MAPTMNRTTKKVSVAEYTPIWDFNIFHNAAIPPPLSFSQEEKQTLEPQLSRLPIQLNGTIVYSNPAYSIANITVQGQEMSESHHIDDEIENKAGSPLARITQIQPERVYFINLNNNQEEYIEVPKMRNITFNFGKGGKKETKTEGKDAGNIIKKIGDFQFQINRSDINKHLRSLPNILQEAKVVPHWEKGKMIGFRFKYIKPGSIYEQLGFKVSDIISSVAGEQVQSQLHAAELFQRFKYSTQLDIVVKRNGKDIPFSWTVNEDTAGEEPPRSRYY